MSVDLLWTNNFVLYDPSSMMHTEIYKQTVNVQYTCETVKIISLQNYRNRPIETH